MRKQYEGMDATNDAQLQFEHDHSVHPGFRPTVINSETFIARTVCLDCGVEFREFPKPKSPVNSN